MPEVCCKQAFGLGFGAWDFRAGRRVWGLGLKALQAREVEQQFQRRTREILRIFAGHTGDSVDPDA